MVALDGRDRQERIAMNLVPRTAAPTGGSVIATVPAIIAAAGERASMRFLEFFAANIRNPHTRRAYYRAAEEFLAWCGSVGLSSIAAVEPVHVAAWIEAATHKLAAPTVKQQLAALRHLFDWLVNGQVMPVNPAHTVRGPRHVVTSGQTPLEKAAAMANHASTRTTQLYDRRRDEVSLDEVERIVI
jgi:site-specific recombinase XerC